MKFTEEQYQKIVEKHIGNSNYVDMVNDVIGYVSDIDKISYEEAILLALPTSREWAHEQFVEKEKKYVWTSKKPYYEDFYKRLYMASNGLSKGVNGIGIAAYEKFNVSEDEYLTETEVRNNGYDPEWFNKEEVE